MINTRSPGNVSVIRTTSWDEPSAESRGFRSRRFENAGVDAAMKTPSLAMSWRRNSTSAAVALPVLLLAEGAGQSWPCALRPAGDAALTGDGTRTVPRARVASASTRAVARASDADRSRTSGDARRDTLDTRAPPVGPMHDSPADTGRRFVA